MVIGNRNFLIGHNTYIMGILNVTPDSFSDGGKWNQKDLALKHVEKMISDGADIIDIGGESTRPGYTRIPDEEEIRRIIPVIDAVKSRFDIPVSVDTYKSAVAKAAISSGVDLINDIWGLKYDPEMAQVIGNSKVACCLMHNKSHKNYQDFFTDVKNELMESVRIARQSGIEDSRIILDPGIGFGKTYEHNLEATGRIGELKDLGFPILLGASRKSFIAKTLNTPVEERLEGTLVTTVIAVLQGCSFVRVHDIKENKRAVMMAEAIKKQVAGKGTSV